MTRATTILTPDTETMIANIVRIFDETSDVDRIAGRDWYGDAYRLAAELDPSDPVRGAAVIAVLSPMCSWPTNVRGAVDIYAGRPFRGLKRNGSKAEAIRDGAEPNDVVSGSKVRSFWLNICDPANREAVTVDRHAIDIALGRVTDDATRNAILRRKGAYAAVRDAYIAAAEVISARTGESWHGSQVQAVTWVTWRKTYAAANHG
jgi:hypothetical protein